MSVTKNKTKVLKSEKNTAKFLDDVCLEIPAIVSLTHRKENDKKSASWFSDHLRKDFKETELYQSDEIFSGVAFQIHTTFG